MHVTSCRRRLAAVCAVVLALTAVGCSSAGSSPRPTKPQVIPTRTPNDSTTRPPGATSPPLVSPFGSPRLVKAPGGTFIVAEEGFFHLLSDGARALNVTGLAETHAFAIAATDDEILAAGLAQARTAIVVRSADSGRSWQGVGRVELPTTSGIASISIGMVDQKYVVVGTEMTSSNVSFGSWGSTSDGGADWDAGNTPVGGAIGTAGGEFWLNGGVVGDEVFRSQTGRTWDAVSLGVQGNSWTAGQVYEGAMGSVVLPVTRHEESGSILDFLVSSDAESWTVGGSIAGPPTEVGVTIPSVVNASNEWFAILPDGSRVMSGTIGASEDVEPISPNGLPSNVLDVAYIGPKTLAAIASVDSCPTGKASCESTTAVFVSDDGGQTWRLLN